MQRVICHWTAGSHTASSLDRKHYHFIFEGDGREVPGIFPVEANRAPRKGAYAAHTLNCNSGSVGLSVACMAGAKSNTQTGRFPMTALQYQAMVRKAAEMCNRYGIAVSPQTVLWHSEVQENLGIRQRGKWDATVLPFDKGQPFGARACGDRLRRDVAAAMPHAPMARVSLVSEPLDIDPVVMEEVLREEGSRTIAQADMVEGGSLWGRFWAVLQGGSLAPLIYYLDAIPEWARGALAVAAILAAVIFYLEWRKAKAARAIRHARVDDALNGKNTARLGTVNMILSEKPRERVST